MKTDQKYTLFYNGVFSNWHKSLFVEDNIPFNCSEQYMMYHKALTFNDKESARNILDAKHPGEQKSLGRTVKNFDPIKWDKVKEDIVYKGLKLKFQQNPNMLRLLKATEGTILVEASPSDKIWGVGYNEDTAMDNIENWGENLLGKLLTKLRDEL